MTLGEFNQITLNVIQMCTEAYIKKNSGMFRTYIQASRPPVILLNDRGDDLLAKQLSDADLDKLTENLTKINKAFPGNIGTLIHVLNDFNSVFYRKYSDDKLTKTIALVNEMRMVLGLPAYGPTLDERYALSFLSGQRFFGEWPIAPVSPVSPNTLGPSTLEQMTSLFTSNIL